MPLKGLSLVVLENVRGSTKIGSEKLVVGRGRHDLGRGGYNEPGWRHLANRDELGYKLLTRTSSMAYTFTIQIAAITPLK